MRLLSFLLWTVNAVAAHDPGTGRDYDCHPSCDTCRGSGISMNWCKSCEDGSPVTNMIPKDSQFYDGFGFCGPQCPTCYDSATPSSPNSTYFGGWPSTLRIECGQENFTSGNGWPLSVNSNECIWTQAQAYRNCGCPEPPPLVFEGNGVACTLCGDGSEPLNPSVIVRFQGDDVTCTALAVSFAHPRLQTIGVSSVLAKGSIECYNSQLQYYLGCGCPEPPTLAPTQAPTEELSIPSNANNLVVGIFWHLGMIAFVVLSLLSL